MKRWLKLPLLLALVGLWALAGAENAKPDAAKPDSQKPAAATETKSEAKAKTTSKADREIHWESDYDAAMAQAKKDGKPVMIDFYTDWCSWCKVLDSKTYTDPKVIDAADKMVALKIDAEAKPDLAKKYDVNSYPRIVFLSSDGKVIHEIKGYKPADQFLPDMQAVLQGKSPQELAQELMKKGTDDPEKQLWVGMKLLDENKTKEALPWLQKAIAKLPDDKKTEAQRILPFVYLGENKKEEARKALEAYKANPKADPEKVADTEVRFAYQIKDRKLMEAALDRAAAATTNERKKAQILQLKDSLDKIFPPEANTAPPARNGTEGKKTEGDGAKTGE